MKKTGVFGGTFDPVHKEHVNMAFDVARELKLDKLIIMPTYRPPHKTHGEGAAAEHRLAMTRLAFCDPLFTVSDYEIKEGGTSYTYKTLEHLKTEGEELYFIVGGDMLVDFKTWRFPERILAAAELAVFEREGYNAPFEEEKRYFTDSYGKSFIKLGYVGKNVSSTKIRVYNMFGLPIDGFTPTAVADYIAANGLYQPNAYTEVVRSMLPERRLIHTANVVACALDKAKPLELNRDDVFTACALHDIAKYLDPKDFPDANIPEDVPKPVVHAFLGEYFAREKLGIKNEDILSAIKYHTSGRAEMSNLEKLVFVADMVEEGRSYDGVEELRRLYDTDFDMCFKTCLKEELAHLKNKNAVIYAETLNAYDYYIKGENYGS